MVRISAPGSILLLGDYVTIHNYPCLAAAINKRCYVTVAKKRSKYINIEYRNIKKRISIDDLIKMSYSSFDEDLKYVLSSIKLIYYIHDIKNGFDIKITYDKELEYDLGLSGSVCTALNYALNYILGKSIDKVNISKQSFFAQSNAQDFVSFGYDIAASLNGGIILHNKEDGIIATLDKPKGRFNICAVYTGYVSDLKKLIKDLKQREKDNSRVYFDIYLEILKFVQDGFNSISEGNIKDLSVIFNRSQLLLGQLGANNEDISRIIEKLRESEDNLGAKISGLGQGGCVLGINKKAIKKIDNYKIVNLKIDNEGIKIEDR